MIDTLAVINDTVMTAADTLKAQQVALVVNKIVGNIKTDNSLINYVLSALTLAGTSISVRCWYIIKKHNLKK